jgi:peptidoglycan/LPS O-acetylase OafA/YrhL
MPAPIKRGQRYMPGLDGLRAIAVLGVIAYHLDFGWAPGGLLGVGVFFTLSGYLITDILLAQVARGGIKLKSFWLARARRLLPALFVMLIVVMAWVTVIGPHQQGDFRTAALTAAGYFNNWWLIFHDVSYFERFAAPSPLNHLWSLSIEEQFYILWPFILPIGISLIPEVKFSTGVRFRLAGATLGLAAVSGILMAILYKPSLDPSRVYYGTDTRALELLIGAALAMVWPSRQLRRGITPEARRTLDIVGITGLALIFFMFWRTGEFSAFLYRGGFLVLSLATAMAVAAMAHPASRLGPVVGCRPMRWIGERSYGIYLWHFPIIVLTTPEGVHHASLLRDALQFAAIVGIASLSWRFIENPIRHGALRRLWQQVMAGRWHRGTITRPAYTVMSGAAVIFAMALAGLVGVGVDNTPANAVGQVSVAKTVTTETAASTKHGVACDSVVHIGDSTSEGLVSSEYLPNPNQLISAQYARIGAKTSHLEVSGARSIYETYEGSPNAHDVAEAWKAQSFHGCWVLALGTNETANVAAGSNVGYDQRIDMMMSAIGEDPVMWVNVKTLLATTPYAESNMQSWDDALLAACDRYPHMRVYDWASNAKDIWYIPDGIHFTSPGYAARGRLIANALLDAFPASEPLQKTDSDNCVVELDPGAGDATPAGDDDAVLTSASAG